ncbi:hypothetical protein ADUPG1_007708 [Aduncisulcus paluster]|uniref:Uncharacterized protein n=1 Tax=Aduncisulcus paluster TaxID=2918883 RepID=A0ABQ5KPA4_9EUKA|nr:hypothetical protein ADUPG1_007708 [Aduncisulcus paluster]
MRHDSPEIISELLKLPMDKSASDEIMRFVNKYMKSGWRLLGLAVQCDKANIAQYLLKLGANPCDKIHKDGSETPLARALSRENGEACANLLVSVKHEWPVGLKLDKYTWHKTLKTKIDECTKILEKGKVYKIEEKMDSGDIFRDWRSRDNQSATCVAFKAHNFDMYAYLRTHRYSPSDTELQTMLIDNDEDRKALAKALLNQSESINSSLILFMRSKTRILQKGEVFENELEKIYQKLDKIPMIRIILQVLEAYPGKLDVVVDFDRDVVDEMTPTAKSKKHSRVRGNASVTTKNQPHHIALRCAH